MGLSDGRICVRDAGGAIEGKVGVWDTAKMGLAE